MSAFKREDCPFCKGKKDPDNYACDPCYDSGDYADIMTEYLGKQLTAPGFEYHQSWEQFAHDHAHLGR